MSRPRHIKEIISSIYGTENKHSSYIASKEWQYLRTRILQSRGGKCEVCGVKHRLQVHHLTYERLGNERDEDLKVLCWACHEREHGLR
jgi:5-methylcytosine-specific restriction endonuclease McrA